MRKTVLCLLMIALVAISGCAQMEEKIVQVKNESLNVSSGDMAFPAYLAAPTLTGKWPGIVMIHSFNGLEPGYIALADQFASEGFVVIAPQWQTFNRTPGDKIVTRLIEDSAALLKKRADADSEMMGLTGFCAGGRYTMLLLPQMDFKSGVAFYGFPYSGGFLNETKPADLIDQLNVPHANYSWN